MHRGRDAGYVKKNLLAGLEIADFSHLKPITQSGQADHLSERSDARVRLCRSVIGLGLAHHHVEAPAPRSVALAELAVLKPLGVDGLVFVPQQREGDALAAALGVDAGPIGNRALDATSGHNRRGEP